MPHRIHKYTNILYDYAQLIINTYVSLMNELKKIGKVLTNKSVGTGPPSYESWIYRAVVSQRLIYTGLDSNRVLTSKICNDFLLDFSE
jgi:hypothetical protein